MVYVTFRSKLCSIFERKLPHSNRERTCKYCVFLGKLANSFAPCKHSLRLRSTRKLNAYQTVILCCVSPSKHLKWISGFRAFAVSINLYCFVLRVNASEQWKSRLKVQYKMGARNYSSNGITSSPTWIWSTRIWSYWAKYVKFYSFRCGCYNYFSIHLKLQYIA